MNSRKKAFSLVVTRKQIIGFTLLVVLAIMAGANTKNPDIHNYIYSYNTNAGFSEGSWLYYYIKLFFLKIGASFEIYRLFLYCLGFYLLSAVNKKLTQDSPFLYVFYALSLVMIDATQTYNYMGMCFFLLGVALLITSEKYNRIRYIVCLLLASGFHVVFLFYIPFVFIYRRTDRKQLLKIYIGVVVIITILSSLMSVAGLAGILNRFLDFAGLNSYQSYLNARTRYGHYYPMMTHLVCCLFSLYYYKKVSENSEYDSTIQHICLLLSLYGIFAFPFFRFQLVLGRLTRNLSLITCISGIDYANKMRRIKRVVNIYLCMLALALFLGYFCTYSSYMQQIVEPFFSNNWILGGN